MYRTEFLSRGQCRNGRILFRRICLLGATSVVTQKVAAVLLIICIAGFTPSPAVPSVNHLHHSSDSTTTAVADVWCYCLVLLAKARARAVSKSCLTRNREVTCNRKALSRKLARHACLLDEPEMHSLVTTGMLKS